MTEITHLINAVKATQELRTSVSKVFQNLSGGVDPTESKGDEEEPGYLSDLQENLDNIHRDMEHLERVAVMIGNQTNTPFGANMTTLTVDPTAERITIHQQLVESYKWTNKMHEHALRSSLLLQHNPMKRSHTAPSLTQKRPKRVHPYSHSVPKESVDNFLQNLKRFFPDLSIEVSRPIGSPTVLEVIVGRTLRAAVVLRGLVIERVIVRGYNEMCHTEDGKVDMWTKSRYDVFRKVTDHTNAAMLHFYSPFVPEIAVRSFMKWFSSYNTLFSMTCRKCRKHLVDNLPPTWRDFRTSEAFHEKCRS